MFDGCPQTFVFGHGGQGCPSGGRTQKAPEVQPSGALVFRPGRPGQGRALALCLHPGLIIVCIARSSGGGGSPEARGGGQVQVHMEKPARGITGATCVAGAGTTVRRGIPLSAVLVDRLAAPGRGFSSRTGAARMGRSPGRPVAGNPPEKSGFRKEDRLSDPVFALSPVSVLA
jgi:hypothetical protein